MNALFVPVSQNAKTGPIPATITERASCWSGCALYEKGCYAFNGASAISGPVSRKARAAGPGTSFVRKSQRSPTGPCGAMRRRAISPAPTMRSTRRWQLVIANRGKRVIAFTHKPVLPDTPVAARNRSIIAVANTAGFTINLSANNPAEADALAELKIGPVVTILAHDYARRAVRHRAKSWPDEWTETIAEWRDRIAEVPSRTPAGRRIAICPATYSAATCKSCGACARHREAIIGLPAHGAWRVVEKATAALDVPPGRSWAFHDHRTMADVIADEKTATA